MKIEDEISIKLQGIEKLFPGVKALSKVSMEIRKGEVHALCGENGAGKSTLMKILTGNYTPNAGQIIINGRETVVRNQKHAQELGISIVYQERSLVGSLSAAENIFTANQPRNKLGFINRKKLIAQTSELFKHLNLNIKADIKVEHLSPGLQQMIEIAKALSQEPDILILDEPTASITEAETQILFNIIKSLKNKGISIIYISHRMAEIFQIADRISVLKDGCYQGTFNKEETCIDDIIRLMVGRELGNKTFSVQTKNEVVFETAELSGNGFENISFKVKKGEILALAGLVGAGRTEVARAIFGADRVHSGEVFMNDKKLRIRHPADAIRYGIGYLPEERKEQGLFMDMNVEENILAGKLNAVSLRGIISADKATQTAAHFSDKLKIKTPSTRQKVSNLSGGNQQKVVLAKWLLLNPKVFIVDEPTHGVDIGAKMEIYEILHELARNGAGIVLISSELPEVLMLSNRVLVLRNGRIVAELSREEATEENIMAYASGLIPETSLTN